MLSPPADLREAAARLRAEAAAVEQAVGSLPAHLREDVWSGRRARQVADDVAVAVRHAHRAATELEGAAGRAEALAEDRARADALGSRP